MERLQKLWKHIKATYAKLPEIIRFVLAILWMLFTWAIIAKVIRVLWHQFDKVKWVQQAAPYFNNLVIYLPFAFIAALFLMAFNRIAELLKK